MLGNHIAEWVLKAKNATMLGNEYKAGMWDWFQRPGPSWVIGRRKAYDWLIWGMPLFQG